MDRVRIQHQFRKAYWKCTCGQEDVTDLNIGEPSVYEHNCSVCNQWTNKFKEYNGCLSYTQEEYDNETPEGLATKKQSLVDTWIYGINHPPEYVEPTAEEYTEMIESSIEEVDKLLDKINGNVTLEVLQNIKSKLVIKTEKMQAKIEAK